MKLSKVQRETIAKMGNGKHYCAYNLQCSLSTLRALERRKLVKSTNTHGYLVSPQTAILFSLTDAGKELKSVGVKV